MGRMRLKHTRKGWYRYWMRFASGTYHMRLGVPLPDKHGAFHHDIWIGPFETAEAGRAWG